MNLMYYEPSYWHKVKEMKEILNIISEEFDSLEQELKKLKLNQFITTADEKTIQLWENFLKLDTDKTLDKRRNNILLALRNINKLTGEEIKKLIKNIYSLDAQPELKNSMLYIRILKKSDIQTSNDILIKAIKLRLPAHIGLKLINYDNAKGSLFFNHGLTGYRFETIG